MKALAPIALVAGGANLLLLGATLWQSHSGPALHEAPPPPPPPPVVEFAPLDPADPSGGQIGDLLPLPGMAEYDPTHSPVGDRCEHLQRFLLGANRRLKQAGGRPPVPRSELLGRVRGSTCKVQDEHIEVLFSLFAHSYSRAGLPWVLEGVSMEPRSLSSDTGGPQ